MIITEGIKFLNVLYGIQAIYNGKFKCLAVVNTTNTFVLSCSDTTFVAERLIHLR